MSNPTPEPDDAQTSEAGSGFDNAETGVGGADAVPDDPDINIRQARKRPGDRRRPRRGPERAREQRLTVTA